MSYDPIPDVEQGNVGLPPSQVVIERAKQRYPAAGTDLEAEFLGRLDDAIDNCKAKVTIPRLSLGDGAEGTLARDVQPLLKSLRFPTIALGVTVSSALVIAATNSGLFRALFPYYSCILTFAASIPDIRQRFMDAVKPIFDKFHLMKTNTERKIDGLSDEGLNYLGTTEKAMNSAIAPIKDKVAMATKLETMLRQFDPSIDIPDTSDIEEAFDGYEDKLKSAFHGMEGAVDVSRNLPEPFKSISNYQLYIILPFLAVMLVLQLLTVYGTQHPKAAAEELSTLANSTFFVNSTNATVHRWLGEALNQTASVVDKDEGETTNQWLLIWIAIQTYLTTALQVIIAFVVTQAKILAGLANTQVAQLEGRVNKALDNTGVTKVFEDIFEEGFGGVKDKFLDLVRKIDKIEQPLRKVQDKIPKLPAGVELPSEIGDAASAALSDVTSKVTGGLGGFFK